MVSEIEEPQYGLECSVRHATSKGSEAQPPLVFTVEEAAERLGIGRTLMFALVMSGEVESVRIGRLRRVPADALEIFVGSRRRSKQGRVA